METIQFLIEANYFKNTVVFSEYTYYYYEHDEDFHGRILVPNNEFNECKWFFYEGKNQSFVLSKQPPKWFLDLYLKVSSEIQHRDRFKKVYRRNKQDSTIKKFSF